MYARTTGAITQDMRQPVEGRSRDGGLKFGEMEKDCVSFHFPIILTNGLNTQIGKLKNYRENVLGYDIKQNGLKSSKVLAWKDKGLRECVRVTLQDGKTIELTPDHPCLNDKNEWKHIKDFKVNSNDERIKCSLTGVVIDFEEDLKNCNGWSLKLDNHTFKTDTIENMFMSFLLLEQSLC